MTKSKIYVKLEDRSAGTVAQLSTDEWLILWAGHDEASLEGCRVLGGNCVHPLHL